MKPLLFIPKACSAARDCNSYMGAPLRLLSFKPPVALGAARDIQIIMQDVSQKMRTCCDLILFSKAETACSYLELSS